jgi:hypothetical protein
MPNDPSEGPRRPAIVLRFDTQEEYFDFIARHAKLHPVPQPIAVREANSGLQGTGLEVRSNEATGRLELRETAPTDGNTPAVGDANSGPAVNTDPAQRNRMRDAAAEAREKLAAQQAADATSPGDKPETTQKRKRQARGTTASPANGAADPNAPVTTEDQSGDPEIGTVKPVDAAADEPLDYDALDPNTAPRATPAEMRNALSVKLRAVNDLNPAGKTDVAAAVKKFAVAKIGMIGDDRIPELWTVTEALCAKHGIAFPPDGMPPP